MAPGTIANKAMSMSRMEEEHEPLAQHELTSPEALFAIVPGAMMPERELVVAELASRRPTCGRRVRV
jgi:hypothetical protein